MVPCGTEQADEFTNNPELSPLICSPQRPQQRHLVGFSFELPPAPACIPAPISFLILCEGLLSLGILARVADARNTRKTNMGKNSKV